MDELEALIAAEREARKKPCKARRVLDAIGTDKSERLLAAGLSGRGVARVLSGLGHQIGEGVVRQHLDGSCCCG